MRNVKDRIMSKLDVQGPDDCWNWTGGKAGRGYGVIGVGSRLDGTRRQVYVHRWMFEDSYGSAPTGYDVCHRCDNPSCGNPAHLFAGSRWDNMQDCKAKGRWATSDSLRTFGGAKITPELAMTIKERYKRRPRVRDEAGHFIAGEGTQKELAAEFGLSQEMVSNIVLGKSWQ